MLDALANTLQKLRLRTFCETLGDVETKAFFKYDAPKPSEGKGQNT